ncbi:MAG: ATP synthase subunit b [Parcubacteria group bacterium GW2011_GWA2_38_13]|nr:MAG: ATP synthase subunit b [Parcubacteria group bacterium GW2011_GWA2_38_13]
MDSIIQTFHIDWKLITAQIVNFAIVVFIFWFFALRPLVKIMFERTAKIEKSLEDAKKIAENLKSSEAQRDAMVTAARKDAMKIMENAKVAAEKERDAHLHKTRAEVEKVVAEGKAQISNEKDAMIQEARKEIAGLVVIATAKVLEKVIDNPIDQKIVKKTIDEINK